MWLPGDELIKLAVGPYHVDVYTGPEIAEKARFRHFHPYEVLLAKEFIRKACLPGTYYFDVYLLTEEAKDWMVKQPENWARMVEVGAHRIDATCETAAEIWLLEFKLRLKYSAIGQLASYRDWFKRDYTPTKPVKAMGVYTLDRPELHETCEKLDIKLYQLKAGYR